MTNSARRRAPRPRPGEGRFVYLNPRVPQDCDDPDYIKARDAILWFANSFYWVDECGELKPKGDPHEP